MPAGERRIYEVNGWYTDDPASPDLRTPSTPVERARAHLSRTFRQTGMATPWLGLMLIVLGLNQGFAGVATIVPGALLILWFVLNVASVVRGTGYGARAIVRAFDQAHPEAPGQLTGDLVPADAIKGRAICARWLVEALVEPLRPTEVLLAFVPGTSMHNVVGLKPTLPIPAGVVRTWDPRPLVESASVPVEGACPDHPDCVSTATCTRCGRFICLRCDERLHDGHPGQCLACWVLENKKASRDQFGRRQLLLSVAVSYLLALIGLGNYLMMVAGGTIAPILPLKVTVGIAIVGFLVPLGVMATLKLRAGAVSRADTSAAAPGASTL